MAAVPEGTATNGECLSGSYGARMKSATVITLAPTPFTPSRVMVLTPSMVTSVSFPRSMDRHVRAEVRVDVIPIADQIDAILKAESVWAGVEAADDVGAETRPHHERVVARVAVHDVVAGSADHSVVACAAIEAVDARAADQGVRAAAAIEHVGAVARGDDVVGPVAGAGEVARADEGEVFHVAHR